MFNISTDIDQYQSQGTSIQKCHGKPFITSFWICQDGNQTIPFSSVCDNPIQPDCQDGSDEDKTRCQGDQDWNLIITIGSYYLLGFVATLICCHDHDETEIDEPTEDLIDHLDTKLVMVLSKKRIIKDKTNLSLDEKEIIKKSYLDLRSNGKINQMYHLLRTIGDSATIEIVVAFLKTIELELNSNKMAKVLEYLANSLVDHVELKHWTRGQYKRGFGYKVEKACEIWAGSVYHGLMWLKVHVLPWLTGMYVIFSAHLDWIKDLLIFYGLRHYCSQVLVKTVQF